MFYIVPKGKGIIDNVAKYDNLGPAQEAAGYFKDERGIDFWIIEMRQVWTTEENAHSISARACHI